MSDFELPFEKKRFNTNPDFEIDNPDLAVAVLPDAESDFETQTQQIIDRSPRPEQTKKILEQATAIHGVTKLPWDEAFNKAITLATTNIPYPKKLGQAITDRWKAEQLSIRIGQTGQAAMKAYQQADEVEIARLTKEYDSMVGQLPAYEDIAPAYPPGIAGIPQKVLGFGRRMLTGAAGLIGQQAELIAGERQTERMGEAMASGKLSALATFAFDETLQTVKGIGEVEAGSAFMDMVKVGVDPGIADRFAKPIGVINNILEFAEYATFIKMFPGAEQVISKATSGLLRKILVGPVLKNTALRLTAKLAISTAQQLAQELAQEATTFYGENWAIAVNNATEGTALEGNKDFADRTKQVVYDFLPGVLALGAIPIGFQTMKREGAGVTARPMVAPAPMETVRADVAKSLEIETPNVTVARATLDIAETAKAAEIEQAEVLTPQLVNEAVELAGMQEAAEEQEIEFARGAEKSYTLGGEENVRQETGKLEETRRRREGVDSADVAGESAIQENRGGYRPGSWDVGSRSGQRPSGVLVESQHVIRQWSPTPEVRTYLEAKGRIDTTRQVLELKNEVAADFFLSSIVQTKQENRFGTSVQAHNKEDYAGMRLFISPDRKTGLAIRPDGDIVSVFNSRKNPEGSSSIGAFLITAVQNGGNHLDAFNTVLPRLYEDYGFRVVARIPWDETQAPSGWDKTIFQKFNNGEPDVVFMVYAGGDPATLWQRIGTFPKVDINSIPYSKSYDEATAVQKRAIESAGREITETKQSVSSGQWVDDATLGQFSGESWARNELASREDLREVASYLADTNQATSFDAFVAAAKEIEVAPRSEEYYRGIWDTTAKAEVELDEAQEVSTEARIDATIAAEEKQTKRIPVTDRLLGELEQTPMWRPDLEKVSDVLAVKELPVTVVEGEELNAAQIANELGQNKKRLVQRMTHDFLKPPSAGIGHVAIQQIRVLQEAYTVKETKSLNKAKKALTAWQTAHPGQALIPAAQALIDRKGIKDITVGELIDLYKQSREIRQKGVVEERARRERIKARRVQMATDMLAEIPGGVVAKRLGEFASAETQKQEKVFARKGKIKSNILHPLRLFQSLGPAFQKTLWDNRKAWEGREITRQKGWDRGIKELKEKTGVTVTEVLRKMPGTDYYIDDLMTYYGQMKDPNGRRAILFGNDEDETKITRLIGELPQKYRDFVDGVIELNNKGYAEVERVQVETNGIASPKVDNYLPLRRQQDFGKPFSEELSIQAAVRESARIAGLQKSFTIQRKTFKEGTQQTRFRTDFLNILVEQIAKESKFVEGEEWARDMGWLLGGKSKESKQFLEAVKQKHGQPVVTFLKDYVNAVIQPESFNGKDFHGLISRVFRNYSNTALIYKLSTIFIQLEGPFRYLSQLDAKQWPYLFAGIWKATTQPGKTLAAMYERSPVMQAMADSGAIDPALQEGRGLRHARSEIGLNLQMARKSMRETGYAGLKAMNAWTIASGWTAVYQANLAKTGSIETAVKIADEATFLTQPSGELADAPRMYWTSKKNIILAFLLRFSRANNQMAQMMTVDLWKDLKTGHPAKALGVVMSFAIGAYLNGLRRRKRPPKDAQEYLEDGIGGLTDSLGAMTFGIVPAVVAGATEATKGFRGPEIKPLEPFHQAAAIGRDILYGNVSEKEVWRLISTVMQATGMPYPAAENVVRAAYDFEEMGFHFDPIELFGRRPKE